jgi:hypothetical protein
LKPIIKISIFFIFILQGYFSFAQQTVISGKVTDAATGEAVPYARVYFKHLHKGAVTSFEGFYSLTVTESEDSLTVEYLGYKPKSKAVKKGETQVINFQIEATEMEVEEVVIRPGENPAWRILRGVWAHKKQNDKASLDAYQYESYSKIEMSITNVSDSFKNSGMMKPFKNIFDSLKMVSGEDGKTLIPFFISETMSDIYFKKPDTKTEHIKASKLSGVGLDDGSLVSQVVGSSLQDYNFYKNWIDIIDRSFISPLADGGLGFYRYYLVDSMVIGGKYCWKIEFIPRNEKDLAFSGTMWINDTSYALKRIIVNIGKKANLNFIRSLHIQQDLEQTTAGEWLPAKERIVVDISEIAAKTFGVLAKFYLNNSKFVVNQPQNDKVYEDKITQDENALKHDEKFWDKTRPDSLTKEDKTVLHIIDTIKNMPHIKTVVDIADIVVNGYYTVGGIHGPVDIGPYIFLLGQNVVEGYRLRIGFRTNEYFSTRWILKGYAAVGNQDITTNGVKYNFSVEHFLSRKSWTKIGIQHQYDIQGLGVPDDFFEDNNLLTAAAQLGFLTRLNMIHVNRIWLESDIVKGFNMRFYLMNKSLWPKGDYNFQYYPDPANIADPYKSLATNINITEAVIEARIAFKETYIINGNRRASIGFDYAPVITLEYARGIKGFLNGGFNYDRATITLSQTARLGTFGHADYDLSFNKIFQALPYPLLSMAPGNQTILRTYGTFNMMNFFEFVTDQSVTAIYAQHFDGLFFNRVPLLKKLKWREVVGVKALWGSVRSDNLITSAQYPQFTEKPLTNFYSLDQHFNLFGTSTTLPYVEVSYGIENIFRFFRVDFIQRLNYLHNGSGAPQFAVKGSFYFAF